MGRGYTECRGFERASARSALRLAAASSSGLAGALLATAAGSECLRHSSARCSLPCRARQRSSSESAPVEAHHVIEGVLDGTSTTLKPTLPRKLGTPTPSRTVTTDCRRSPHFCVGLGSAVTLQSQHCTLRARQTVAGGVCQLSDLGRPQVADRVFVLLLRRAEAAAVQPWPAAEAGRHGGAGTQVRVLPHVRKPTVPLPPSVKICLIRLVDVRSLQGVVTPRLR